MKINQISEPPEGMEFWEVPNYAEPVFGAQQQGPVTMVVHASTKCAGDRCPIHNPSEHPLSEAPFNWRGDTGVLERICRHGVGHPDPDNKEFYEKTNQTWKLTHGCDGCCMGIKF